MSQKQSMSRDEELREFVKIAAEHRAQGAEILFKLDQVLRVLHQDPNTLRAQQERLSQEEQLKPPAGHLSQIHQHSLPVVE